MARMRLETLGLRAASRKRCWAGVGWKLIRRYSSPFVVWALKPEGGRPNGWGWPAPSASLPSGSSGSTRCSDRASAAGKPTRGGQEAEEGKLPHSISNFIIARASREGAASPWSVARVPKLRDVNRGTGRASGRGSEQWPVRTAGCRVPGARPRRFGRGLSGHTLACPDHKRRACPAYHGSRSAGRGEPAEGRRRVEGKLPTFWFVVSEVKFLRGHKLPLATMRLITSRKIMRPSLYTAIRLVLTQSESPSLACPADSRTCAGCA